MGLREEIQSEVAAAFDEDLADAVSDFSGSYVTHRHWDPVTETGGESTAIYTGRGVLTRYKLGRIDGINILHGDLKLTALTLARSDSRRVTVKLPGSRLSSATSRRAVSSASLSFSIFTILAATPVL